MLRVGYPATLPIELFLDFPGGIELIPVSDKMDHDVEIEVWIPDPYSTKAIRAWPRLNGVKLVLAMMAGTEWIPGTVGPHVTICNARGAHNIATAEWTLSAILAMLKYIPLYLDIQRSGVWKRRIEASAHYAAIHRDTYEFSMFFPFKEIPQQYPGLGPASKTHTNKNIRQPGIDVAIYNIAWIKP